MKSQIVRLNLELSLHVVERIKRIKNRTHAASATEVIRRSLLAYDWITEHTIDSHGAVLLRYEDGTTDKLALL